MEIEFTIPPCPLVRDICQGVSDWRNSQQKFRLQRVGRTKISVGRLKRNGDMQQNEVVESWCGGKDYATSECKWGTFLKVPVCVTSKNYHKREERSLHPLQGSLFQEVFFFF